MVRNPLLIRLSKGEGRWSREIRKFNFIIYPIPNSSWKATTQVTNTRKYFTAKTRHRIWKYWLLQHYSTLYYWTLTILTTPTMIVPVFRSNTMQTFSRVGRIFLLAVKPWSFSDFCSLGVPIVSFNYYQSEKYLVIICKHKIVDWENKVFIISQLKQGSCIT